MVNEQKLTLNYHFWRCFLETEWPRALTFVEFVRQHIESIKFDIEIPKCAKLHEVDDVNTKRLQVENIADDIREQCEFASHLNWNLVQHAHESERYGMEFVVTV